MTSEDRLVEAHEQIVRSERRLAVAELAAGVAHDLRNPLGAINNAVYYLKNKMRGSTVAQANPKIMQFFSVITEQVDRSARKITDLITFARPNPPNITAVDLTSAVESSLSALNERTEEIHIVKKFAQEPMIVLADSEQLEQVIGNLAVNAIEAMPKGGSLTITTQRVDGLALTSLSDTGEGIGEGVGEKIFDPVFTTKVGGIGLGLPICRQIVSSHGGSIEVTSNTGPGTTFTVSLPLATSE